MRLTFVTLVLCLPSNLVAAEETGGDRNVPAPLSMRGLVSLIDDVDVPAERAGVLTKLTVKEGAEVDQGAVVAEIDAVQAALQHAVAQTDLETARARAANELEVQYAAAEHRVRNAEHEISLECNAKQPNSVSLVELERLRLAAEQAKIKIGVSQFERTIRSHEVRGFDAKLQLSAVDVQRRTVTAPIAGEVAEVFFRPGEWVEPGKPILRLVRLDRLRVETFVRVADRLPHELIDQPLTISVTLARGRRAEFNGRVTFVNPAVQPGGDYRVWAEVENRRETGHWLLRPGMEAEIMSAHPTANR